MKLSSKLPEDHGLFAVSEEMVRLPEDQHYIVAVVDCSRLTTDVDTGDVVPTARLLSVEVMTDDTDVKAADRLMRKRKRARSGQLEVDVETGEIVDDGA